MILSHWASLFKDYRDSLNNAIFGTRENPCYSNPRYSSLVVILFDLKPHLTTIHVSLKELVLFEKLRYSKMRPSRPRYSRNLWHIFKSISKNQVVLKVPKHVGQVLFNFIEFWEEGLQKFKELSFSEVHFEVFWIKTKLVCKTEYNSMIEFWKICILIKISANVEVSNTNASYFSKF